MINILKSLMIIFPEVFTSICLADVNDVIIQEGSIDAAQTGYFKDLVVDTNLIFADLNTQRVGIGTASPEAELEVKMIFNVNINKN